MIATDPAGSIQHYPMSMKRFGQNPFGENRFRIVLATSRRFLVAGQWNGAGTNRAKWCMLYPHIGPEWILEEWQDAFTFSGMTATQWNSNPDQLALGPYPLRGDYQMCGDTSFDPAQINIDKLITLVHAADKYSWAEKLRACRDAAQRDEKQRASKCQAIILDALPAFGHAPGLGYGGALGAAKSSPVLKSANELCLPIPNGRPGEATTGGGQIVKKRRKAA